MSNLRKPLVIVVLALVAVLAIESAVLAATIGRNGRSVTAVRTLTDNSAYETSSGSWIDVREMKTFVTVPAGEKAILLITFSAASFCDPGGTTHNACFIRVTLDGNEVSPGPVTWSEIYTGLSPDHREWVADHGARSMQWVAGPVGPGSHQVKVQASIGDTSGNFHIDRMTLSVLRSKV